MSSSLVVVVVMFTFSFVNVIHLNKGDVRNFSLNAYYHELKINVRIFIVM